MMNVIKSEIYRIKSSKRSLFVFIFLLVLLPVIYFSQNTVEKNVEHYLTPEYRITESQKYIIYYEDKIHEVLRNPEKTEAQKKTEVRILEDEIAQKEDEIKFAKDSENQGTYKEDEKKRINAYEIKILEENASSNPTLSEYFNFYKKYAGKVSESGYYMDTPAYSNALIYVLNLVSAYSVYILGFGVMILGISLINGEYHGNRILRFAKTPASRDSMYLGKFFSLFLWSSLLFILMGITGTIITGILKGTGPSDFPMIFIKNMKTTMYNGVPFAHGDPSTFRTIPLGNFAIYAFLYEVLFIFTLSAFILFLSCVFRNTVVAGFIFIMTVVLSTMLPNISPMLSHRIAHINFMSYINPYLLFTGRQAEYYKNSFVTPTTGLLVLCFSAVLFLTAGMIWFKKQGLNLNYEESNRKESKTQYINTTMSKLDVKTSSPWDKHKE